MDALWFGCIPVLIADYYVPPLLGLIQWNSIAITVPEAQVKNLKKILISIPDEQVGEMQLNIQRVYMSTDMCSYVGTILIMLVSTPQSM